MGAGKRDSGRWRWLAIAVVVLAAAAAAYYRWWGPGSIPVVETARVARGDLRVELSATGIVKADQVEIAAEVAARIERVAVQENERVQRGELLVALDRESLQAGLSQAQAQLEAARAQVREAHQAVRAESASAGAAIDTARAELRAANARLKQLESGARPQEIRTAQARAEQARAQFAQADRDLERMRALHADGAVSRQTLDQARTARRVASAQLSAAQEALRLVREGTRSEEIEAAHAQVEAARAGVDQAQAQQRMVEVRERALEVAQALEQRAQAQVTAAQAEINRTEIRSPTDATVVQMDADPGEIAQPGVPLMTLSDLSRMWVEAEIDDVDLDKVRVGQEVTVLAEAFPGRAFAGHVFEISKSAEPKLLGRVRAKIVRAKVRLAEPAPLTAEMEVDVESRPVVARDAVLVPNEAVRREGNTDYVFVVTGGHVQRTAVRVGQRSFQQTEILHGVSEGQAVALPADEELRDGQRVRLARE